MNEDTIVFWNTKGQPLARIIFDEEVILEKAEEHLYPAMMDVLGKDEDGEYFVGNSSYDFASEWENPGSQQNIKPGKQQAELTEIWVLYSTDPWEFIDSKRPIGLFTSEDKARDGFKEFCEKEDITNIEVESPSGRKIIWVDKGYGKYIIEKQPLNELL